MTPRADLTERLLTLSLEERALLVDLYQARFADDTLLAAFAALSASDPAALRGRSLLRSVEAPQGRVHYLSATGQRAARSLLQSEASGARAYAALRLAHELARAELYLCLRRQGMPAAAYRAEPRLPYRSAAGLGERTLVPDASVEGRERWLIEVDRGTEGGAQLRHKWLRYREWLSDERERSHLAVLQTGEGSALVRSIEEAGLSAALFRAADALSEVVWGEEARA